MTEDQMRAILDRVLTWPAPKREDAAHVLLALEAIDVDHYQPQHDEWTAIAQGLAQARRGESVPVEDIVSLLKPRG